MKKHLNRIKQPIRKDLSFNWLDFLLEILLLPILVIGFICLIFYLPYGLIRYFTSQYYRDTKKKKSLPLYDNIARLYDHIKKNNLKIEYVDNGEFEYFIKDNEVLLYGYLFDDGHFTKKDGDYIFYSEENHEYEEYTIDEAIEHQLNFVKDEHKNLNAKILILNEEDYLLLKDNPKFYCFCSIKHLK